MLTEGREVIVPVLEYYIVELYMVGTQSVLKAMLELLVLSNRKKIVQVLYVTSSLSIPFLFSKPLVFLYSSCERNSSINQGSL